MLQKSVPLLVRYPLTSENAGYVYVKLCQVFSTPPAAFSCHGKLLFSQVALLTPKNQLGLLCNLFTQS